LYNIPAEPTIRAASKNSFAIVEYTPQAYLGSDLDLFFANLLAALDGSYCTKDGGDDPSVDGVYPEGTKDPKIVAISSGAASSP
jgi:tripeptidyl-peptidase-1